ncbi:unnamed protein product, partial [Lampetra fluviatilis]
TEEVDKASVLRTRAMREREGDSERPPRQYHYCLLRVPAALLTLVWDPDVHADILAASSPSPPSSQPPSSSSSSPSPSSSSSPSSSTCPPCCLKAELMAACLTLS